jgi:aspartate-semialdehyde dehydrogenase
MSVATEFVQTTLFTLTDLKLLRFQGYVDGRWVDAPGGASIAVRDPADGSSLGQVAALTKAQSEEAVVAAAHAFPGWAALLPQARSALLRRWYEAVLAARDDLAAIMTAEQGKPLPEARGEIEYAASFIEFYAEEAKRPNVESVTSHLSDAEVELWREPLGVVALVTPWNFPCAMLTRKAAAALAAGCTVVAHPSKETPFSALALAELADRVGLPRGVFNVLPGRSTEIVPVWTADTRVRGLSFTGSTEIGRLLYAQSAATVKRLVLELGGHAPFLSFADADLERVVEHALLAKFATSGQDCLAANRILVERPLYESFCRRFAERVAALRVGPGRDSPDIGPLISESAVRKQESQVADALARGARCLTGGRRLTELGALFYAPTVLADVPRDAAIQREETFGPVASVSAFDSEDEALAWANDTEYGLIAYLHTRDPARIYRLSRALQYGMVAVNRTKVTGPPIPFGGVKQSGLGREGGRFGLEQFTEIKYVCRDWS